jgi:hypothetical protein
VKGNGGRVGEEEGGVRGGMLDEGGSAIHDVESRDEEVKPPLARRIHIQLLCFSFLHVPEQH